MFKIISTKFIINKIKVINVSILARILHLAKSLILDIKLIGTIIISDKIKLGIFEMQKDSN